MNMPQKINQSQKVFDAMHKLEQAGMLEQAEIIARVIDNRVVTLDARLYIFRQISLMICKYAASIQ